MDAYDCFLQDIYYTAMLHCHFGKAEVLVL